MVGGVLMEMAVTGGLEIILVVVGDLTEMVGCEAQVITLAAVGEKDNCPAPGFAGGRRMSCNPTMCILWSENLLNRPL